MKIFVDRNARDACFVFQVPPAGDLLGAPFLTEHPFNVSFQLRMCPDLFESETAMLAPNLLFEMSFLRIVRFTDGIPADLTGNGGWIFTNYGSDGSNGISFFEEVSDF